MLNLNLPKFVLHLRSFPRPPSSRAFASCKLRINWNREKESLHGEQLNSYEIKFPLLADGGRDGRYTSKPGARVRSISFKLWKSNCPWSCDRPITCDTISHSPFAKSWCFHGNAARIFCNLRASIRNILSLINLLKYYRQSETCCYNKSARKRRNAFPGKRAKILRHLATSFRYLTAVAHDTLFRAGKYHLPGLSACRWKSARRRYERGRRWRWQSVVCH